MSTWSKKFAKPETPNEKALRLLSSCPIQRCAYHSALRDYLRTEKGMTDSEIDAVFKRQVPRGVL